MGLVKRFFHFIWTHKRLSVVLLILVLIVGFILLPKPKPEILTEKVTRSNIAQSVSGSGKVSSETTVNLNFLAGGKLVYVGAQKGDTVVAGQTIASLDQRSARKTLEQKLIDYSKQRNTFDETKQENQNRTPEQALNDAMKRVLQNNQYDLNAAVNSVELQQLSLEGSYLISPINGIVTRADVAVPGVNVGATTTYTVVDPDNLVFSIDIDESDIGNISPGQQVLVTLDAFPDNELRLDITSIDFASHASDTGGTVYTVEAKLPPNTGYQYRIGMSGDATIVVNEHANVLTVPLSSVEENTYVYRKTEKGFEKVRVKTGLESDTNVEIIQGLKEGDSVAVDPETAKTMVTK